MATNSTTQSVKIEDFRFSTEIDVRISDINYGGHLGNDRYLSLLQDARLRYLNQFGYSEMSVGDGISLIMREAKLTFKAEAFWGDRLKIYVRIAALEAAAFRMDYLIVRSEDESRVIATGETEMLGFDYAARKVKRLPLKFIEDIENYETPAVRRA